jgi:hypothetical protein
MLTKVIYINIIYWYLRQNALTQIPSLKSLIGVITK